MHIPNVPVELVSDEAPWYLVFNNQAACKEYNGQHIIYDVVVPHFAGGSLAAAIENHSDLQGDYETIQRSGTCSFRCVLAAVKYLLKREGFSRAQRKQWTYAMRLGFLDRVEEQLTQMRPETPDLELQFNESDEHMIELALQQTARAAVKQADANALSVDGLRQCHERIERIQARVRELRRQMAAPVAPMRSIDGEQLQAHGVFGEFELQANTQPTTEYCGDKAEAAPELFCDLTPLSGPPASTWAGTLALLRKLLHTCEMLRRKASMTAASLGYHQISALIERVLTELVVLPQPPVPAGEEATAPACLWRNGTQDLAEQRLMLTTLLNLTKHYTCCVKSLRETGRAAAARQVLIMGCLFAAVDATLRIKTSPPSPVSDLLDQLGFALNPEGWLLGPKGEPRLTLDAVLEANPLVIPSFLPARAAVCRYTKVIHK